MATNQWGLDTHYLGCQLSQLQSRKENYKPDEMARALMRLAVVADPSVLREPEFAKLVVPVKLEVPTGGIACKGSKALGSGCGKCYRCDAELVK